MQATFYDPERPAGPYPGGGGCRGYPPWGEGSRGTPKNMGQIFFAWKKDPNFFPGL